MTFDKFVKALYRLNLYYIHWDEKWGHMDSEIIK